MTGCPSCAVMVNYPVQYVRRIMFLINPFKIILYAKSVGLFIVVQPLYRVTKARFFHLIVPPYFYGQNATSKICPAPQQ